MKKIVIIGGGYAGIYALRELVKNKDIKITLIDKHTFHNLQPEVYDIIANKSNIADVTIDLTTLCNGFEHNFLEFKNLRVTDIDTKSNIIYTQEKENIAFDYLIMATGTRTFFPKSIDGLKNTDDIKKLHRAIFFKQSFETQLFNKASAIASKLNVEKNKKGQIVVNEYLQTSEYENIFAVGDVAQIKNDKDEVMPHNVTIARASGVNVGKNILNL